MNEEMDIVTQLSTLNNIQITASSFKNRISYFAFKPISILCVSTDFLYQSQSVFVYLIWILSEVYKRIFVSEETIRISGVFFCYIRVPHAKIYFLVFGKTRYLFYKIVLIFVCKWYDNLWVPISFVLHSVICNTSTNMGRTFTEVEVL